MSLNKLNSNETDELVNLFSREVFLARLIKAVHKQPLKLLYFTLIPKKTRTLLKVKAKAQQRQYVAECWRIFLKKYFSNDPSVVERFNIKPKKELLNKKIIWQYWGQGVNTADQPEIVKTCFSSVDKYKGDYQVIRLDDNNLKDYIDLPEFIAEKRKNPQFRYVFFSDLLRLALLDSYGGIWIDATILLTAPIPNTIASAEFFMFQRDQNAESKAYWEQLNPDYFGWSAEHNVNMLSSFIVGKAKNEVIHTFLDLVLNFWKTQDHIPHYFFFQILFNELISTQFSEQNCLIIDDTLPHLLQRKLAEPFNQQDYDSILAKSSIHKLFYLKSSPPNSYYEYIKDQLRVQGS